MPNLWIALTAQSLEVSKVQGVKNISFALPCGN
jgi:hypothetical protein